MTDQTSSSVATPVLTQEDFEKETKGRSLTRKKTAKTTLDTNIYLSAILFGGNPRKIIQLATEKEIIVCISPAILLEVAEKLNQKFKWNQERVVFTIKAISKIAEVINPKIRLGVVKKDPDDNKILECAVESSSDYVVTGDKHLLDIGNYQDIKIVNASSFLKLLG